MSSMLLLATLAMAQDPTAAPAEPAPLPPDAPSPEELLAPRDLPPPPPPPPVAPEPADPPPPPGLGVVLPQIGERTSNDVMVFVRSDGQAYLDDSLVTDEELVNAFAKAGKNSHTRVIFSADMAAQHGRVVEILDMVKRAGITKVGIAVASAGGDRPVDPLFPGGAGVENLDTADVTKLDNLSRGELRDFKPRHGKYAQNPYDNVDYTAYTLEWGETKIGLGGIFFGVAPRLQIGTQPIGDLVRFWNLHAKWNAFREKKMDLAFRGNLVYVPVGSLLRTALDYSGEEVSRTETDPDTGEQTQVPIPKDELIASAHYLDVGMQGSLQLVGGWSLHGTLSYASIGAQGKFSFEQELPFIPIPVEQIPDSVGLDLSPRVNVSAVNLKIATDYRFNRRDSLVLQYRYTPYAKAQLATKLGVANGIDRLPNDVDFALGYGGWELATKPRLTQAASLSYERSMRNIELRLGYGISSVPGMWALGAIDLSYRFGGKTRRTEREIKQGYKDNRKDLRQGGDAVPE